MRAFVHPAVMRLVALAVVAACATARRLEGHYTILIRRIGFAQFVDTVEVTARAGTRLQVLLEPQYVERCSILREVRRRPRLGPSPRAQEGKQLAHVRSFEPLLAAEDSGGRCEVMAPEVLQPGESGALLRFGTDVDSGRIVSVVWDSSGTLKRYSDVRGDLRGPRTLPGARGARTSILIRFREDRALLLNEIGGHATANAMTSSFDAFDAAHLGPPQALVARLHTECGSPSSPW